MVRTVPTILSKIVEHKKSELAEARVSRAELEKIAESRLAGRRNFPAALSARKPAIIAEVKKASPSKGLLQEHFDPRAIARAYASGGASAMSVLTDQRFFQGALSDLEAARAECKLPVLRKDFTISEYHVVEAAAHGADAILLIAAILETSEMRRFRELAATYGLASLVEVHDADELSSALDSGAGIVGVNNRNLHDFTVTLDTSLRLAERIPPQLIRVSESGIHGPADVRILLDAGYSAFLVGEHLMKSGDPTASLAALTGIR